MADADPAAKRVGVAELRANLRAVLREAQRGQSIEVVSRGSVLAQIGPPRSPADQPPRQLGALSGKIWMAADFETWPSDIAASFERAL